MARFRELACSATIWMRVRVASRRNAPQLIVRCLTPISPTVTLAQAVLARSGLDDPGLPNTSACAISPRQTFRRARPSAEHRANSPDIRPVAARAVHPRSRRVGVEPGPQLRRHFNERVRPRRPRFCFGLHCAVGLPPRASRRSQPRQKRLDRRCIDHSGPVGVLIGKGNERLLRPQHLAQQPNRIQVTLPRCTVAMEACGSAHYLGRWNRPSSATR